MNEKKGKLIEKNRRKTSVYKIYYKYDEKQNYRLGFSFLLIFKLFIPIINELKSVRITKWKKNKTKKTLRN